MIPCLLFYSGLKGKNSAPGPLPDFSQPPPVSTQRHSMPSPYGWDQSLTQMASGGMSTWGSTSVPTTPIGQPYIPQTQNQNFPPNYSLTSQIPAKHNNFYAGTVSGFPVQPAGIPISTTNNARPKSATLPNKSAMITTDGSRPNFAGISTSVTDSTNASAEGGDTGFNLVPNVDYDAWTDADSFFAQFEESDEMPSDVSGNSRTADAPYRKHQRKSSDLIQLGFEGILTSEEKEYFSLEYFDPLHRKGRTASISSPSTSSSHYFFAKPPEESKLVSTDRNKWVTFDADDSAFGRSEGDGVVETREATPDELSQTSAEDSRVRLLFTVRTIATFINCA